jgi:hypothetical protein
LQNADSHHAAFTAAENGTYTVGIGTDALEDMDGNASVAGTIGTFKVAVPAVPVGAVAPTATLKASTLTDNTQTSELLSVTYSGASAIASNTLDDNDILVTGPSGYSQNATFVSSTTNPDGSTTAIYSVENFVPYEFVTGDPIPVSSGASNVPVSSSAVAVKKELTLYPSGSALANGVYSVSVVAGQVNDVQGAAVAADESRAGTDLFG